MFSMITSLIRRNSICYFRIVSISAIQLTLVEKKNKYLGQAVYLINFWPQLETDTYDVSRNFLAYIGV